MSSSKRSPMPTERSPALHADSNDENVDPNAVHVTETITAAPVQPKEKPGSKEEVAPKKRKSKKEVDEMIRKMLGTESEEDWPPQDSEWDSWSVNGNCVKAAIYNGFINITGDPSDLKMIVHSEKGECGHVINATLGDLLNQPDYAGLDYEDGLQDATVLCTVEGCADDVGIGFDDYYGKGRTYVTMLCWGNPQFDCGRGHNHCMDCEKFGQCIGDYREAHCMRCGEHYFAGLSGFPCSCEGDGSDSETERGDGPIRTKKEIDEMIRKMLGTEEGDSDPDLDAENGNCVKAAIYNGFINITGDPSDLKMIVHSEEGECGHVINATLGDLLEQPDYAGTDYENGLEDATVLCKEEGCDENYGCGRTYVTRICEGRPEFDSGKFHNHCNECKIFGKCIGDYREAHCMDCGDHYFAGMSGFPCPCKGEGSDSEGGDAFNIPAECLTM